MDKLCYEDVRDWEQRWQNALQDVMPQWLSGQPLNVIGESLHAHRGAKGHVKAIQLGRRFALQAAGGLGHGVSLVAQVFERKYSEKSLANTIILASVNSRLCEGRF